MRDISGADFKFAKTLTLDFFGSGMVDLPPGGAKRVKNSRKMQMVFFVFYGRVEVSMGTPLKTFSIGKGGQWQVPRGKLLCSLSPFITTRVFRLKAEMAQRQNEPLCSQSVRTHVNHLGQTPIFCGFINMHYLGLHFIRQRTLLLLLPEFLWSTVDTD